MEQGMRKQRYKEKRPMRLGVMQVVPTRHEEPSYVRSLVAAGLIAEGTNSDIAWGIWQSVCRDAVVIRLAIKLEKVFIPSVAAPFQFGTRVLAAMSSTQIAALKKRLKGE
jgi:hypothetical protein